jgi:heat shock protein HslJ
MKRAILFFATIILTTLMIGCCDCRKRAKFEKPLVGTEWQLVQFMGRDVMPQGDCYTLLLHDNGNATGQGDCNRFTATYVVTPSRALTFADFGSTRRFCENFETENRYFDLIEQVTHYEMDAESMLLFSNGVVVAIMRPKTSTQQ